MSPGLLSQCVMYIAGDYTANLRSNQAGSLPGRAGDKYIFTISEGANGSDGRISVNYDGFIDDVAVGCLISSTPFAITVRHHQNTSASSRVLCYCIGIGGLAAGSCAQFNSVFTSSLRRLIVQCGKFVPLSCWSLAIVVTWSTDRQCWLRAWHGGRCEQRREGVRRQVGDIMLVDGGLSTFKILSKDAKDVRMEVVDGGKMTSRCPPPPSIIVPPPQLLHVHSSTPPSQLLPQCLR